MSLADELQKIQQLRESGALTEDEFQRTKGRLLAEEEGPVAKAVPYRKTPAELDRDARQWAFFLHFSQYAHVMIPLGGIILPVVLWQLKKDEYPDVVGIPLCFVLIGIPLVILLVLAGLVCPLIGALKANNGEIWTYPGAIPFFK